MSWRPSNRFARLRRSASLESFQDAFVGRLHALARAHDLLVDQGWASAEIGQLVRLTLRPYRGARVEAEGPLLSVRPQAGVTLVMILHELATNAAKYGALSVPTGTVSITWASEDGDGQSQIQLNWIETGGPPVEPPSEAARRCGISESSVKVNIHRGLKALAALIAQRAQT